MLQRVYLVENVIIIIIIIYVNMLEFNVVWCSRIVYFKITVQFASKNSH